MHKCARTHIIMTIKGLLVIIWEKIYLKKKKCGATTSSTSLKADVHIHLEHYASLFLYIYTVDFKCSSTAARRQAEDVKHDTFAGGD